MVSHDTATGDGHRQPSHRQRLLDSVDDLSLARGHFERQVEQPAAGLRDAPAVLEQILSELLELRRAEGLPQRFGVVKPDLPAILRGTLTQVRLSNAYALLPRPIPCCSAVERAACISLSSASPSAQATSTSGSRLKATISSPSRFNSTSWSRSCSSVTPVASRMLCLSIFLWNTSLSLSISSAFLRLKNSASNARSRRSKAVFLSTAPSSLTSRHASWPGPGVGIGTVAAQRCISTDYLSFGQQSRSTRQRARAQFAFAITFRLRWGSQPKYSQQAASPRADA